MEKHSHIILETIAKNMRKQRKHLGLSQEELADVAGCHRTYIGMIERSEINVTITNLYKIAKALNINVTELLV